ncbi:MAG: phytanoyl-CoA dioxygenase family protein [Acidobacteria bacterium]|nr:phytanoyl-CoA dioxygenase family protein [Acidobacteriota bacterium]
MKLSPEQYTLFPSDEDVRFYREHGYYVSKKIFSHDEIDEARYGSKRYYVGERDFSMHNLIKPFEGWTPKDGEVMRINDYVSLQNREVSDLVRNPLIGAIAGRLSGCPEIRLWHDQMIYKPAGESGKQAGIGWHTDRAYWSTCSSSNMLTAWIPFDDTDESMGTLEFIDGSHTWSGDFIFKGFHSRSLEETEREIGRSGRQITRVFMNLKKGQVSFHHCLTIHGSGPNYNQIPRHSLSVHLQDVTNSYLEYRKENGEPVWHRNDMLCRSVNGKPDYTDPDICPTLWAE